MRAVGLVALAGFVYPSTALGVEVVAGAGVGAAVPQTTGTILHEADAEATMGYAGRVFGWYGASDLAMVGLTGTYVGAPTDAGTSTAMLLGPSLGVGSPLAEDTAVLAWLTLGYGYSNGACNPDLGVELGMRVDQRVGESARVGSALSFLWLGSGCPTSIDDAATSSSGSSSQPPFLRWALVATLDISAVFGAARMRK